jgi:hypothetical protein
MEANELREILQGIEGRLSEQLNEVENRLREHIDERENRLREHIDERENRLREYIDERENRLREYIDERTHDAETRIVRAFGAYQQSATVRFRKIEADLSNVNASTTEQMDAFQSKLLELETRLVVLERPAPPAA